MRSFDVDLRTVMAAGGALGAAEAVLRAGFDWSGTPFVDAAELLAELQRPEIQDLVVWRQDRVNATPDPLSDGRHEIASENQWCWQAAQRTDGVVEMGGHFDTGWRAWCEVDLADLLLRLLVQEAVIAAPHLHCSDVPAPDLRPTSLLDLFEMPDSTALPGVLTGPGWLGTVYGDDERWWVNAAPVDPVMAGLAPLHDGRWHRTPGP